MIVLHQRMMRHGWCIPHSLEWLFWPIGTAEMVAADPTKASLSRRFKLTNRDAFLEQLRRLGAVREQKP